MMTAREAAEELGVSVATIYSYVSRGLIRSHATGAGRERSYRTDDVLRLKERKGRGEAASGDRPPLLEIESKISLVHDGRLYYRGEDAVLLSRGRSVGEVAALIWTGEAKNSSTLFEGRAALPRPWVRLRTQLDDVSTIEAFQIALTLASDDDPSAWDLRPNAVASTGSAILHLLVDVAAEQARDQRTGISDALQQAWAPRNRRATDLFRAALILTADHQVDEAVLAARCITAAGANPYAAVSGALSAFHGTRNGGGFARIEALLAEIRRPADATSIVRGRLQRGDTIPGFGHDLYPGGDARSREILTLADRTLPAARESRTVANLVEAVGALTGDQPTLEFALVAVAHMLKLQQGSALTLASIGRSIGWIGHVIEQMAHSSSFQPRLRYTGSLPD